MLNQLERFESSIRRWYSVNQQPLTLAMTYTLGRHIGMSEEELPVFVKRLHDSNHIHMAGNAIVPNMLKTAYPTQDKIKFCIRELKKNKDNPTPNDILNEFQIMFGRPENAETFLRMIRDERNELMKAEPFIKKDKHEDVQKSLL